MKIHRSRRTLRFASIVLLGIGLLGCGGAPSRTLTLMAPAAPGGGWDQTAREMQRVLREAGLARTVQVVNVPGAGGTVGLAQLVNTHRGDGDLLMVNGLIMVGSVLTNHAPVTLEQTTPIARLLGEFELLVVPAASPHRTLADLIQAWKANPGLAIAGGSAGGTDHMLAGLLAKAVGIDVTKVNYVPHSGGGESLASLLGGHVAAGINGSGELISFVQAGQLRALAISSDERVPGWDIPTFVEQGVDVTLSNWRSVAAAPGITSEQRAAWVELMDRMRQSQAWKDTLQKNNWTDMYLAGPAFEDFLKQENTRAAEVLESIGLMKP